MSRLTVATNPSANSLILGLISAISALGDERLTSVEAPAGSSYGVAFDGEHVTLSAVSDEADALKGTPMTAIYEAIEGGAVQGFGVDDLPEPDERASIYLESGQMETTLFFRITEVEEEAGAMSFDLSPA